MPALPLTPFPLVCIGLQWRHFGAEYKDMHTDYTGQGYERNTTLRYPMLIRFRAATHVIACVCLF